MKELSAFLALLLSVPSVTHPPAVVVDLLAAGPGKRPACRVEIPPA